MNYEKVYNKIIQNRIINPLTDDVYSEKHHIIPRSLGGTDDVENLVRLTAREHFICHALLSEMYEEDTNEWHKMNLAFKMMKVESYSHTGNRYFNSRLYELKKKDFSKVMSNSQSGKKNSQYGKVWIYNLDLRQSISVSKDNLDYYLESGWIKGRVIDFDLTKKNIANKELKILKYERQKAQKKVLAKKLFEQFLDSGCDSIRKFSIRDDVTHSQGSLSLLWKRWIPELYNPNPATKFKNRV